MYVVCKKKGSDALGEDIQAVQKKKISYARLSLANTDPMLNAIR
jgi:hypothetical protein